MDYTNYVPIVGTILSVTREGDCCSQRLSVKTQNGIVNFTVSYTPIDVYKRQEQDPS